MNKEKSRRNFIKYAGLTGFGFSSLVEKNELGLPVVDSGSSNTTNGLKKSNFRASVVKVNITPSTSQKLMGYMPRMSDGVRDPIFHKVLVMDDGANQFVLVSTDIVRIAPSTYDEMARRLFKATGIKKENFWWTFTHTHSGPEVGSSGVIPYFFESTKRYAEKSYDETYYEFVLESLLKGATQAMKELKPAQLGIGSGYAAANINRRARDIDDKIFTAENPDGPVDRKIGLMRIDDYDGKTIALISNYAIHPTVLPSTDTRISGDIPGVIADFVEKEIGAPLLFINGAEGNIAPRYSVSVGSRDVGMADRFLNQFRRMLGDKILEANRKITSFTKEVHITADRLIIETPMRESLRGRWPEEMKEYARKSSTGMDLIRFPISLLFLNDDIAIWGAPCELFCEISNYIREHSPFPHTFYFGLTNGSVAYFPTKTEMELGGYEAQTSPFTTEAEQDLVEGVSSRLEREYAVKIERMHKSSNSNK